MDTKQKKVIDSFVRVRSFLVAHPTTGPEAARPFDAIFVSKGLPAGSCAGP